MVAAAKKFTATDGTEFTDRNAWRKYEFETQYTFKRKHGETLVKLPDAVQGQPFELMDLTDCEVQVLDHSEQVQCDDLHNCKVFIAACSEALFVRNCTNCTFIAACKQVIIV
jgi:Tubulin binding cofactor C